MDVNTESAQEEVSSHPYNHLTPDAVMDAVESQGFYCDLRIMPLNSYENRVYQVGIEESAPLIAKFYRPQRWSDEQILEEHRFTQALTELEIPVVAPMRLPQRRGAVTTTGQPASEKTHTLFEHMPVKHSAGEHKPIEQESPEQESTEQFAAGQTASNNNSATPLFRFALYPRCGGQTPELDNKDNLMVLGRYLGRIHALGKVSKFKYRPAVSLQTYAIESSEFLLAQQFIPAELNEAYSSLCRDLIAKMENLFDAINYQAIRLHGDCHPGNILWRDDKPHFVDFDDARNGPAVQDLWMLLAGDRLQQTEQITAILKGYLQFCEFNMAELGLIESLRTMRIMHYAAWLARRWHDPAFPHNFPWFNTLRYWSDHILELREQLAALNEPVLTCRL